MQVKINNQTVTVKKGDTILSAARAAGIYIPSLCSHPDLPSADLHATEVIYQNGIPIKNEGSGAPPKCGLCVVRIEGQNDLSRACVTEVEDGMVISTEGPEISKERKIALTEILRHHPNICITCDRDPRCPPFGVCVRSANVPKRCVACPGYEQCELLRVADHVGMTGVTIPFKISSTEDLEIRDENPLFDFDPDLCIGCTRCIRFCRDVRGVGALGFVFQDGRVRVGTTAGTYPESGCRYCLGCVEVCPTGALTDKQERHRHFETEEARRQVLVPCQNACPLHIDIPGYIYLISQKKYEEALALIEEKLPFPLLCGTVCTHPCEAVCRRGDIDDPLAIKDLKRFVAQRCEVIDDNGPHKKSGKAVAIVGSGPAGLAAAYLLARKGGYSVTVFEAMENAGGMLLSAIPRFRLPEAVLELELDRVRAAGVNIITRHKITSIDPLFEEGFHAVLVATGAHKALSLGIEGEDSVGVIGALDFLRDVNLGSPPVIGGQIAVIGGGSVALDAARTAVRCKAREVTLFYRRSQNEMPADPIEIEQAREEGVKFEFLAMPVRITPSEDVIRIHFLRTRLRGKDRTGRPRAFPVRGSEFHRDMDRVIVAIGQHPEIPAGFELATDKKQRIKVNPETGLTSRKGVFAAGDMVTGPGTVTEAIAMGIRAARAIDASLGGTGLIHQKISGCPIPPFLDQDAHFFSAKRSPIETMPVPDRCRGFDPVDKGFDEESAVKEANRCLRCSLRLDISRARIF